MVFNYSPRPPPPPPPKPEKLTLPVPMSNTDKAPNYPKSAQRKGIEGVVTVVFDVLENGTCANAKILNGPEEFHETVLRAVATWRYRPATRGGKPVRHRMSKRVVFRLDDA
jgi:protein TonB